jgi:hypothetical protein
VCRGSWQQHKQLPAHHPSLSQIHPPNPYTTIVSSPRPRPHLFWQALLTSSLQRLSLLSSARNRTERRHASNQPARHIQSHTSATNTPSTSTAMAVQSNGRAKKPKKAASNGTLNGNLNGGLNGHMNGHADKSQKSGAIVRSPKTKPRKTAMGSLTNIFGRYDTSF